MSQRSPFNKRNLPTTSGDEEGKQASGGMMRKSPTKAKPAREAASSVRVVTKRKNADGTTSTVGLTKEEKKAARAAEREQEDLFSALVLQVMKRNELYIKRRRGWGVFMGVGIAFVVASIVVGYIGSPDGSNLYDTSTTFGLASAVCLFLAYVFIIATVVWDFIEIRPIRRETEEKVRGLSEKKRRSLLAKYSEENERARASKPDRFSWLPWRKGKQEAEGPGQEG